MWAIVYVAGVIGSLFGGLVYLHWTLHGVVNILQASIALFLAINLLICFWEIVLFFKIDLIKDKYQGKLKKLERGDLGKIFLFEHVDFADVFKMSYWTEVWVVYSLMDPSYSDTGSFGWSIDIGNGVSTLPPTILFALGMSLQDKMLPPRVLGLVGALSFYQMFYGTVIYFTQYIVNKRWLNHGATALQIFVLVVCSNIVWIIFPLLGLYSSSQLLLSDSSSPYSIFVEPAYISV